MFWNQRTYQAHPAFVGDQRWQWIHRLQLRFVHRRVWSLAGNVPRKYFDGDQVLSLHREWRFGKCKTDYNASSGETLNPSDHRKFQNVDVILQGLGTKFPQFSAPCEQAFEQKSRREGVEKSHHWTVELTKRFAIQFTKRFLPDTLTSIKTKSLANIAQSFQKLNQRKWFAIATTRSSRWEANASPSLATPIMSRANRKKFCRNKACFLCGNIDQQLITTTTPSLPMYWCLSQWCLMLNQKNPAANNNFLWSQRAPMTIMTRVSQ